MKATAAECLLPVTSQAIRKHFRDRGAGAGVAPEFRPKQNSALVGHNGWMVDDAPCPEIGDKHVARESQADTCLRARAGLG